VGLRGGVILLDAGTGKREHAWRWPHVVHSIHPAPDGTALLVTAPDGFHRLALPRDL
jgi:hypothetical protein